MEVIVTLKSKFDVGDTVLTSANWYSDEKVEAVISYMYFEKSDNTFMYMIRFDNDNEEYLTNEEALEAIK